MLQSNGVTPLESVGHTFDPNLHEAMRVVESDSQESGGGPGVNTRRP